MGPLDARTSPSEAHASEVRGIRELPIPGAVRVGGDVKLSGVPILEDEPEVKCVERFHGGQSRLQHGWRPVLSERVNAKALLAPLEERPVCPKLVVMNLHPSKKQPHFITREKAFKDRSVERDDRLVPRELRVNVREVVMASDFSIHATMIPKNMPKKAWRLLRACAGLGIVLVEVTLDELTQPLRARLPVPGGLLVKGVHCRLGYLDSDELELLRAYARPSDQDAAPFSGKLPAFEEISDFFDVLIGEDVASLRYVLHGVPPIIRLTPSSSAGFGREKQV